MTKPGAACAIAAIAALCSLQGAPGTAQTPPALGQSLAQLPPSFTQLPADTPPAAPPSLGCDGCGIVTTIRQTKTTDTWTPLGMGVGVGGAPSVGGGDPGLGNAPSAVSTFQIGPGLSNQGIVVLGSAGGASYRKAPNSYERPRWEVTVKLDAGGMRIVTLAYEPYVREGDRVRVSGNTVALLD